MPTDTPEPLGSFPSSPLIDKILAHPHVIFCESEWDAMIVQQENRMALVLVYGNPTYPNFQSPTTMTRFNPLLQFCQSHDKQLPEGSYNKEEFRQWEKLVANERDTYFQGAQRRDIPHWGGLVHVTSNVDRNAVIMPGAMVDKEATIGSRVFIGRTSIVQARCYIGDYVVIGANVLIEKDTSISGRSVIGDEVRIANDCRIRSETQVGPGTKLGQCVIIGRDCEIARDVSIGNNSKIEDSVSIHAAARIGADCFIKENATIGKDAHLYGKGHVVESGIQIPQTTCLEIGSRGVIFDRGLTLTLGGYGVRMYYERIPERFNGNQQQIIHIGCQKHTFQEWDAFDDDTIHLMDESMAYGWWGRYKSDVICIARTFFQAEGFDREECEEETKQFVDKYKTPLPENVFDDDEDDKDDEDAETLNNMIDTAEAHGLEEEAAELRAERAAINDPANPDNLVADLLAKKEKAVEDGTAKLISEVAELTDGMTAEEIDELERDERRIHRDRRYDSPHS